MFNKNLKYYRLKNNLTKTALASMVGVSTMSITHYESGERRPDMATIKALAEALGVRITDFLNNRNTELVFSHAEFRKNSKLNKNQQEYIRESVEEYFSRFYEAVDFLGGEVLPEPLELHSLSLTADPDVNAQNLRRYLQISNYGPVGDLIGLLENKGVLVFLSDFDNDAFSGMNGTVNNRPYIVINKKMTAERIRTTIVHEISHFAFIWPEHMSGKEVENMATAIAGAFLFPSDDVKRELGIRRKAITKDMYMVCKEYGIAISLLVVRAFYCHVISESIYKDFFIHRGSHKKEPSLIRIEEPTLFAQLVYRAVNEEEITIQKGAELLHVPYDRVAEHCCYAEV